MSRDKKWDVAVIGAGPAGLAAATAARQAGAEVCVIERENRPGGILKQCIHDGFGLVKFREKLTGPEYAYRYVAQARDMQIPWFFDTFLTRIEEKEQGFHLTLVNSAQAVFELSARTLVLATGCRERTDRQVFIHGTRPAGIFTAGLAQYMINIQGYMPTRRCVILGSGDIGLIMARRLTLEGAQVSGVYEIKPEPSGLTRNVVQCLEDYRIPLHLAHTVTEVHGVNRVESVTVCQMDKRMKPLPETAQTVPCDSLILSVGLIPENEIAEQLGVKIDPRTKGAVVDQTLMTSRPGVFSCGNCLHVNDLVDYVSESGEIAGTHAAMYAREGLSPRRKVVDLKSEGEVLYHVPQQIDLSQPEKTTLYFRSSRTLRGAQLTISAGDNDVFQKRYAVTRPPEMERVLVDFSTMESFTGEAVIRLEANHD